MNDLHPLDLAWGSLTREQQRNHAKAEAEAFYRRPCREFYNTIRPVRQERTDAAA